MLNVKYHKDLNHNFLIINHKLDEKDQNYQYRMISGNKIGHLLNCKIRYVDEECSFYYEISSKQNLRNLYEKKKMEYGNIYDLLESIREALENLDIFLLDSRCLMLMPEYIFAEPEAREYFFLYYPCLEEADRQSALMSLAEFLLDKVDREQEEATEIVYKIYETIQDNRFILPQILSWFDSSAIEVEEVVKIQEMWSKGEEAEEEEWSGEEDFERVDREIGREESDIHLPIVGILSFLCAGAAAAVVSAGYFFTLSREEKLVAMAGTVVLIVMSALMFLYFILNLLKKKNRVKIERKAPVVERQNVERIFAEKDTPFDKKIKYNKMGEYEKIPEEYGNTVFLDTSLYKKENKLYGINKGNKYHISLENLPCTIGKMAGNVDIVIKDSTISRIHARFTRQEDGIYVTDMNSTNGTFKNGLRLEPNETVRIECGDELRFGKMIFCYR